MTDALVFTWSGSFRDEFASRMDAVADLVLFVRDRFGMEVGVLTDDEPGAAVEQLSPDFTVGPVDDLAAALDGLTQRYGRVFFVSDVRAELAAATRTAAFTVGYAGGDRSADELGGVGPNYIVDSLDELQQILLLEMMDG